MKDYSSIASSLYEGGWRASDKNDLRVLFHTFYVYEDKVVSKEETEEDLDNICELLAEYERG